MSTLSRTLRRGRRQLALAAALAVAVAAAPPVSIDDPCGGGLASRADICSVTLTPLVDDTDTERPSLTGVRFEYRVDGDVEHDRLPTDIWEVTWLLDGCVWALRWFHDPGTDAPGSLTTRLERECPGALTGIELAPPTVTGGTLTSEVSVGALRELADGVTYGTVLERVGANSYTGVGVQTDVYGYSQASKEHDDTARSDVPLR